MENSIKMGIVAVVAGTAGVIGGFIWGRKKPSTMEAFMEGVLYHEAKEATKTIRDILDDSLMPLKDKRDWVEKIYTKEYLNYVKDLIDTNIELIEAFVDNENRLKKFFGKRPEEVKYFRTKLEVYVLVNGTYSSKIKAMLNKYPILGL